MWKRDDILIQVVMIMVFITDVLVYGRRIVPSSMTDGEMADASPVDPQLKAEQGHHSIDVALDGFSNQSFSYPHPQIVEQRSRRLSADDHLVTNLPGLNDGDYPHRHWAGHIDVDKKNGGHLFYWLFEAWGKPSEAPLVVWINGGPGCSSSDGLFLENGPFKIDSDQQLKVHEHSWAKIANMLYIDQPVGTGLSYTTGRVYPRNDAEVNYALMDFFDGFFQVHSELRGRTLFLSGESHAGHFLPSIANVIVKRNEKLASQGGAAKEKILKLAGIAIGNGWFDPHNQYDVSDFAHGSGLISAGQVVTLKKKEHECHRALSSGRYMYAGCWDLLDDVVKASGAQKKPKVLMYDIRQYVKSSSVFPPNHGRVEKFLNNKAVRAALHASSCPIVFKECTDPPYNALKHQDGLGVTRDIVYLLERKVQMLFFNGQYDMICNHMGVEKALDALKWSGRSAFSQAVPDVWLGPDGDRPSGYARSSGPLTLLFVMGAGHMVPLDRPEEALDMLRRFITSKSFADASNNVIKGSPLPRSRRLGSTMIYYDPMPNQTWGGCYLIVAAASFLSGGGVAAFFFRKKHRSAT